MVGRYHFENGKVTYSNQLYDTRARRILQYYGYNMSRAKVSWYTIFSPIDETAFQKHKAIKFNETLHVNPSVCFWKSRSGDPVMAITEGFDTPTELELKPSLKVKGFYMFNNVNFPPYFQLGHSRPGNTLLDNPAHEQTDKNGTIWVSVIDVTHPTSQHPDNWQAKLRIYTIKGHTRTLKGTYELNIFNETKCNQNLTLNDKTQFPGYTHFIQTTKNYILLPQTSYRYDFCKEKKNGAKVMPGFLKSYEWHPDVNASITVFERKDMTKIHHVVLPYPKFFTHDINAFEDSTHIYLDTLAFDNVDPYLKVAMIREAIGGFKWKSSFLRIAIDKASWVYDVSKSGPLTKTDPHTASEFTQINYAGYHQEYYTYTYFVENALYRETKVGKLNVLTSSIIYWNPPLGYYPQEPIFVQSPGKTGEDEGILLCSGPISNPKGTSFLAILNAKDMKQIALVKNPNTALFGLHNRFYPTKQQPSSASMPQPQQHVDLLITFLLVFVAFIYFR